MKYSLRSLMIAVLVLPPLLAWGWLLLSWLTTPELVYPGQHREPRAVSLEQAKAEVVAEEIERKLRESQASAPIPPKN